MDKPKKRNFGLYETSHNQDASRQESLTVKNSERFSFSICRFLSRIYEYELELSRKT